MVLMNQHFPKAMQHAQSHMSRESAPVFTIAGCSLACFPPLICIDGLRPGWVIPYLSCTRLVKALRWHDVLLLSPRYSFRKEGGGIGNVCWDLQLCRPFWGCLINCYTACSSVCFDQLLKADDFLLESNPQFHDALCQNMGEWNNLWIICMLTWLISKIYIFADNKCNNVHWTWCQTVAYLWESLLS